MIRAISSMATRRLLGELAAMYQQLAGATVHVESVGGIDAARRVQADEPFDVVFLAADAIEALKDARKVVAGSRVDIVKSGVNVAVPAGARRPDISTEAALERAVLDAPSLGYSTGPSGTALVKLFERWGIAQQMQSRLVQAPPGVPVASLIAEGRVALGFQQLSELIGWPGIAVIGPMPVGTEIVTTFSSAICATCTQQGAARELLAFMASPQTAEAKHHHGMEPA